jgi:hypothetical protein
LFDVLDLWRNGRHRRQQQHVDLGEGSTDNRSAIGFYISHASSKIDKRRFHIAHSAAEVSNALDGLFEGAGDFRVGMHISSNADDCCFAAAGAILLVSVPATIIKSLCRGEPRGKEPNRSMSQRGTPATLEDLVTTLAFALRYAGRKRIHDADVFMSEQVARRLAAHLRLSGFVVMKRPPTTGHSGLSRGPKGTGAGGNAGDGTEL